jgi:hypothetical protein
MLFHAIYARSMEISSPIWDAARFFLDLPRTRKHASAAVLFWTGSNRRGERLPNTIARPAWGGAARRGPMLRSPHLQFDFIC